MTFPGGILEWIIATTTGGFGASVGFFFVRWLAIFTAGRWDKREAQLDAGTKLLIEQLTGEVRRLSDRLEAVEHDLAECKKKHAETESELMQMRAANLGFGDARQHAQLIVSEELRKDRDK